MISELVRVFGPWGIAVAVMAYLLKVMVADKLISIQRTLSDLVDGQSDHAERIVRIEAVMQISGCGVEGSCSPSSFRRRATDAR